MKRHKPLISGVRLKLFLEKSKKIFVEGDAVFFDNKLSQQLKSV